LGGQDELSLSRFTSLKYRRRLPGLALDEPSLGGEELKQPVKFLMEFVTLSVLILHDRRHFTAYTWGAFHNGLDPRNKQDGIVNSLLSFPLWPLEHSQRSTILEREASHSTGRPSVRGRFG